MKRSLSRRAGFSLLEIVIAVSVIVVLAGVISISAKSLTVRAKVAKTANLVQTLKTACAMHHADCGTYPYEYTGYAASSRQLSGTQTYSGWKGPYLESPFSNATINPFGGSGHIYSTVTANGWLTGFDLDGDGTDDVTSSGNMLWLSGVPSEAATAIDSTIDGTLAGTWSSAGRVRYNSSNSYLYVLLYN
jgi:prepilin-type N-terminal cleavage/methylation domain-containing protein